MSTPGSVRSGEQAPYTAGSGKREADSGTPARPKRTRIFRWQGVIPVTLALALLFGGWVLFGDRAVRSTLSEAGTKALGAQLDIAGVRIQTLASTVELRGISLADPFDRNRNLLEVGMVRFELEP